MLDYKSEIFVLEKLKLILLKRLISLYNTIIINFTNTITYARIIFILKSANRIN